MYKISHHIVGICIAYLCFSVKQSFGSSFSPGSDLDPDQICSRGSDPNSVNLPQIRNPDVKYIPVYLCPRRVYLSFYLQNRKDRLFSVKLAARRSDRLQGNKNKFVDSPPLLVDFLTLKNKLFLVLYQTYYLHFDRYLLVL